MARLATPNARRPRVFTVVGTRPEAIKLAPDRQNFPPAAPSPAPRPLARDLRALLADVWADVLGRKPYYRFQEREDRRRRVIGRVLLVVNFLVGLLYLGWLLTVLDLRIWFITLPFFVAEATALIAATLFAMIIWYPRRHRPEGLPVEHRDSVDVFIATCGEPIEILTRTVAAATRIDYEPKTIYILDDRGSAEVATLARHLGCRYLNRTERRGAKAGNLNFALAHSTGDLILALDADQVPEPQILKRMVGYFRFPDVAFVQSKQRFLLPEGDPFGNSDTLFYEVMQNSKDNDNAAFSCGSGVVYRRKALESVGGFSTWNLVEDVHTSMRLHAAGWRSVYHNHPLTTGTAPADVLSVCKQREQWATDSLRLLFWDNPFRHGGLTLQQRLQYFYTGFAYLLGGVVLPLYFVLPAWTLLTGTFMAATPAINYGIFRGAYFICTLALFAILEYPVGSSKPYKMWAGLFPVFMRATIRALGSRRDKPKYRVNGKIPDRPSLWLRLRAVLPQITVVALNMGAIIYGAVEQTLPVGLLIISSLWGLWAIWSMTGICWAAVQNRLPPELSPT